jgi:hypothetical protein
MPINPLLAWLLFMLPMGITLGIQPVSVLLNKDNPAGTTYVHTIHDAVQKAKQLLEGAQQRQKAYADSKRRNITFNVGQAVLLSTTNIRLKSPGTQKLLPRVIGPAFQGTAAPLQY